MIYISCYNYFGYFIYLSYEYLHASIFIDIFLALQISIEAKSSGAYMGDIALDNVLLRPGPCCEYSVVIFTVCCIMKE